MPCWPSVFITRLATQPRMPPTTSHMIKFIETPSLASFACGGHPPDSLPRRVRQIPKD
jgi:hypothetical protein